ncbi:hypothetical protein RvY_06804 [Ramazzottius varieornatus]|uniref:AMOP domain-containing protein n=1 Tax=Ramazzottius varieornatus TaxID=947166 RepID=A0A1D1UZU9_RAMVA|nr:hypothetical protein RvY_06804 [Ramazzottius varieornatus]
MWRNFVSPLFIIVLYHISGTTATIRYYSSYTSYGTGDTTIQLFHNAGGPLQPHQKWIAECFDGEAATGIQDQVADYKRITALWCRFTFVNKPASGGRYPYYPSCHVRNMTDFFFCFDPQRSALTVNTFMTAVWDSESMFFVNRLVRGGPDAANDTIQPYKCCKTPPGYYIDYTSCYYVPTHDIYWEYYDSPSHNIVYCRNGFVITGWAKKVNPWNKEWHLDWLQCCRVGYGPPAGELPPDNPVQSGMPSYSRLSEEIPAGYRHRYRRSTHDEDEYLMREIRSEPYHEYYNMSLESTLSRTSLSESMRYRREPIPKIYKPVNARTPVHSINRPIGCESTHAPLR